MANLITPRTLKGFRDYLPEAMIPRERLIETARRVYRSYGFSPIDTPALEYLEILAGKGSEETDKQLYKFQDHGQRWVGLLGEIVAHDLLPICRSQIDIKFTCPSQLLAERMPGFHWMTGYGDYLKELGYALKRVGIQWEVLA